MKIADAHVGGLYTTREDRVFVKHRCYGRDWLVVRLRHATHTKATNNGARDLHAFDGRTCLHVIARRDAHHRGPDDRYTHHVLIDDEVLPVLGSYWRSIEEVISESR